MADIRKSLPENVPGDFFVDSTCIDCDACRQIAPAVFRGHGDQSSVYHQNAGEVHLSPKSGDKGGATASALRPFFFSAALLP